MENVQLFEIHRTKLVLISSHHSLIYLVLSKLFPITSLKWHLSTFMRHHYYLAQTCESQLISTFHCSQEEKNTSSQEQMLDVKQTEPTIIIVYLLQCVICEANLPQNFHMIWATIWETQHIVILLFDIVTIPEMKRKMKQRKSAKIRFHFIIWRYYTLLISWCIFHHIGYIWKQY